MSSASSSTFTRPRANVTLPRTGGAGARVLRDDPDFPMVASRDSTSWARTGPLYFTREPTNSRTATTTCPTHYSFQVKVDLAALRRRYERRLGEKGEKSANAATSAKDGKTLRAPRPAPETLERVLAAQDERGAWVEEGRLRYFTKADETRRIIDPRTFRKNATILARDLAARSERP